MRQRIVLLLLICIVTSGVAVAQTGGQLWVRSYEDRDGNGARDAGEPLLTRGVSVNLLNSDGVVIASALLDSSPNAAQGLVGFQLLPAGEYSVVITSADYTATTGGTFTTTVSDTGVPPVLEFGAQPVAVAANTSSASTADAPATTTAQLALAAAGAAVVMCSMVIVGIVVYFMTLRRQLQRAVVGDPRMTTGSMRAVQTGTGEFRRTTGTIEYRKAGTGELNKPDTGEFRKP